MGGQEPVKKQGPIRFEAIVPLAIIIGLMVLYFMLFFDAHLRRGIEYGATQANGAEVNIGRLQTSFWDASVVIGLVEMTNPQQPERNRLQLGEMRFSMTWDALLRGKILIQEATVEDVLFDTPRKSPGLVLPPAPPSAEGESATDKMLASMQQEFSGNVVGDLAAIAAGERPADQLSVVGAELKSGAMLDGMQLALDEKEQLWRKRMADLPKGDDFSALRARLDKVKTGNFKDAQEVQASLQELEAIRKDFDAKVKPLNEAGSALGGDMGALRGSYADLERSVQQDVRDLQSRMKLPTLDVGGLSNSLFGMDVLGKVHQARGYMEQAREYMPAKSKQPPVRKVSKGRDYVFGTPTAYPRFWLRKALLTSKLPDGSGLAGQILDISTDQAVTGRPTVATLKGDMPQQQIAGIKAELVIDHTTEEAVERLNMEIAQMNVPGRTLVNSPKVTLGFDKAQLGIKMVAELRGSQVDLQWGNRFSGLAFQTQAQSPIVHEMVNASVSGLQEMTLDARVSGTWDKLGWNISTNLADALASGMGRYLQDKMNEAKARIEGLVQERIGERKKALLARQGELEKQLRAGLDERKAQMDRLRADLDKRKNTLLDAQKQKLQQGAGKLLDRWRK